MSLAFAGTPQKQLRILKTIGKEWEKIDRRVLHQAIRSLYRSKLIDFKEKGDGEVHMILSDGGRRRVLEYNINEVRIRPMKCWDGRWRIVVFDIPKEKKKVREAFRFHLKRLGFYQLQKSVFIFPYECQNEVDFLVEFYQVRPYVRQIVAVEIDNALHLKQYFDLR